MKNRFNNVAAVTFRERNIQNFGMKWLFLFVLPILLSACNKFGRAAQQKKPVSVKASVISGTKSHGQTQAYWKAGIIFSDSVRASGRATITWYHSTHWVNNGTSLNHFSKTISFDLDGNQNKYYEFTDIKLSGNMKADSVRITSFSLNSCNCTVTAIR